jgi:hypothetical protein
MNFLLNIFSGSYEELWKAIIRPIKDNYTIKDLGPEKFRINNKYYKRTDLTLRNSRNQILMCSYWEPYDEEREYTYLPCVIYLHGNSSSRCEVIPNLKYLLPLNITVFAFDFAACGHSEGEYISLGWYEIFDVKCVINYLRKSNKVSAIGLWGRSMGAVTSIMYAEKDPTIGGIFLDSPFFSLNLLMDELSKEKVAFPSFLVKQVLIKVKETVKEKAKFNIDDINTEKFCKKCFVPSFFCHGKDDNFVRVHHCEDLYKIYPGEKNILIVEGDHNDIRPDELNEKAAEFFYYALKCKYIKEMNDYNFGYKLIINDWNNPKFRTPTGNEKNINNKNNKKKEINNIIINDNNIYEFNKNYSETIRAKNEPQNNYSKKVNNLKFNNKLKYRFKNTEPKLIQKEKNNIYMPNDRTNKRNNNMKLNHSNDNIANVNFNNYKKIQVNTNNSLLSKKDSFNFNYLNTTTIKKEKKDSKKNSLIKTELKDKNEYRKKIHREIIKINYPNRTSNSVNKFRINNNIIQLNNTTINKKKNVSYIPIDNEIKIKYPEPTLTQVNNPGYNYNYFNSTLNSNTFGNSISNNNNIYYTQNLNLNDENKNFFYFNNNNNIYNNIYI